MQIIHKSARHLDNAEAALKNLRKQREWKEREIEVRLGEVVSSLHEDPQAQKELGDLTKRFGIAEADTSLCQKPSEHLRSELKRDHIASDFKCKQIGATRSRTYFRSPALTSLSYGYALSRERLAVLENDALLRLDDQASTASP